jgi:hypothetical protein
MQGICNLFSPVGVAIISRLVPKKFENKFQIADGIPVLADRLPFVTSQCKISPETCWRETIIPACYDRMEERHRKRQMLCGGRNKDWAAVGFQ